MTLAYDGVTDDRAALQSMIDACPPGGKVELDANRVCRLVIDNTLPDRGLVIKPNVTLNLNGTLLAHELHHDVYGTRFMNGAKVMNGRAYVTVSDGLSSVQGIYHSIMSLGDGYGEVLNINNRGPFIEASGWGIHNMELSTVKPNGLHISGVGGVCNGHITDIVGLDNATAFGLINFDWGTVGTGGTIAQNRAAFNNSSGTFCTVHPNNIKIERIRAGLFTSPTSEVIRLSACSAIDINNVDIKACGASAFSHYGGDYAFEFCRWDTALRSQAFMNTSLRNLQAWSCRGNAIRLDTLADNIAREPGYVPFTNPIYPTNMLIDGVCVAAGVAGVTALNIGAMAGGIVSRVRGNSFHQGAVFASGLSRFLWTDSVMHGSDASAIAYNGAGSAGATINRVIFES